MKTTLTPVSAEQSVRQPPGLLQLALAVGLGCLLVATPVSAGPGDPFGGNDTGCVPSTKPGLVCAKKAHNALAKLRIKLLRCHIEEASQTFQIGMATPGTGNQEELCEETHPTKSAKAWFDARIAALAECDATVLANANAARDVILADGSTPGSMDALNGEFFCDSTSGELIDPDEADAGYISATAEHFKCAIATAKAWSRLQYELHKCHSRLAGAGFKSVAYDDDECEGEALARYDERVNRYLSLCSPCLASSASTLGSGAVSDADAELGDTYICPGP
jgi:hypothetical protein